MTDHKFLIFFIICATYAAGRVSIHVENEEERCKTRDCQYIYTHLISRLNTSVNRCEDIHSYTCSGNVIFDMNKHIRDQYFNTLKAIKQLFLNETFQTNYQSLSIEKSLYQQCMKLGIDESFEVQNDLKYQSLKSLLYETRSQNVKWQKIDHELSELGFGHALFNIRVIRNPENSLKNIIMIEPPSLSLLSNTIDMITSLYYSIDVNKHEPYYEAYNFFYGFLKAEEERPVIKFLHMLIASASQSDTLELNFTNGNETSIYNWHRTFNRKNTSKNTSYVDWSGIIIETFREVGVDISENEPLIVKNELYFAYLLDILRITPNDGIATSIVMIAMMSNLRYINWKLAQALDNVEKSTFCLYETKLYGASYAVLRDIEDNGDPHVMEKLHEILNNIVSSTKSEIYKAQSLSFKSESYLLAELDAITAHVHSDMWTDDMISNYYNEFSITESYFANIMNYRKMMRNKELINLRQQPKLSKYLPFSLVDLHDPANRFAINMIFHDFLFGRQRLPNQIYYAKYGVRLATTLYALLNENKIKDVTYYYGYPLKAYPVYCQHKLKCVLPEVITNNTRVIIDAVSNLYGLKITYNAMKEYDTESINDVNTVESPKPILFPKENINDLNQIFYLSYVESHCDENASIINFAVRQSKIFGNDFKECSNIKTKCKSTGFEYTDKRTFLVKL